MNIGAIVIMLIMVALTVAFLFDWWNNRGTYHDEILDKYIPDSRSSEGGTIDD